MIEDWRMWIEANWTKLAAGKTIEVAEHRLGHPQHRPELFKKVDGFPHGQSCDWAMPLEDGKRVHVQCFEGAQGEPQLRVHVDKWDPNHSLGNLVLHALFETPVGLALGVVALVAASKG